MAAARAAHREVHLELVVVTMVAITAAVVMGVAVTREVVTAAEVRGVVAKATVAPLVVAGKGGGK